MTCIRIPRINVYVSTSYNIYFSLIRQLFSAVLALHVFLFQIKTTAPYPATRKVPQESLHVERDHQADELIRSMNATHHDGQYEVGNTSSHQLLFEHAHVRRARQASGCLISKAVEQCGNDSIVTVTCRARSVTCIQYGGAAPRCVIKKTYYEACRKTFDTECLCEGSTG